MKYLITLLFLSLFLFTNCNRDDDDDCPVCEECEVCEEVEIVDFLSFEVDFFSSHRDFLVQETEFETVTEQVLVKPVYNVGAVFESVTEQYLHKASYIYPKIEESQTITVVVDAQNYSIGTIDCYRFFYGDDITNVSIPAEYKTLTKEVLVENGTGAIVPAEYSTITKEIVSNLSELIPVDSLDQTFERVTFTIPDTMTIQQYLNDQFLQQEIENCMEGNAYRLVE